MFFLCLVLPLIHVFIFSCFLPISFPVLTILIPQTCFSLHFWLFLFMIFSNNNNNDDICFVFCLVLVCIYVFLVFVCVLYFVPLLYQLNDIIVNKNTNKTLQKGRKNWVSVWNIKYANQFCSFNCGSEFRISLLDLLIACIHKGFHSCQWPTQPVWIWWKHLHPRSHIP